LAALLFGKSAQPVPLFSEHQFKSDLGSFVCSPTAR
jgi:hypothetical protein